MPKNMKPRGRHDITSIMNLENLRWISDIPRGYVEFGYCSPIEDDRTLVVDSWVEVDQDVQEVDDVEEEEWEVCAWVLHNVSEGLDLEAEVKGRDDDLAQYQAEEKEVPNGLHKRVRLYDESRVLGLERYWFH